ncbi:MAG: hypothetical protein AAFV07_01630 [Bacteroidota bacterium]
MASGKLSSRQKMINMMYLVLLAILALNVSIEALDAFVSIRSNLHLTATEASANASTFIDQLKNEIDREIRNEGKRTNEGLKDTLDQIHLRTGQLIASLDRHMVEMEAIAKYDDELEDYIRKDEQEKNYQYWMGADEEANERRGNGAARMLRDSLNEYFTYLNTLHNSQVPDSTRQQADLLKEPQKSKDPGKRWEQYTFEGPVVANMATLEGMKIDIFRREKQLLDLLNTRLGINIFVPDTVVPISAPISRIVPAGLQYETRLFIGMSSKTIKPEFASNNGRITVDSDGNAATLSIPASGSVIAAGKKEGRQRFNATIRVPKATGGFQELTLSEEFIVRKPEVLLTARTVQRLYRNCANVVSIDVPALGDAYSPRITATDATVTASESAQSRFRIVPTGRQSIITVKSQTNGQLLKIDDLPYQVVEPPKPSIGLKVNGRTYNGTAAVPRSSPITVKIIPDPEFARDMPEEAKYQVESIDVLLKSGLEPARVVKSIPMRGRDLAARAYRITLPTEVRQSRPGAKVFIKLNTISRQNFRGQLIPDRRIPEIESTIPLVLR